MWCFQSVFQLPVLSFQLLFWHLTNSSHSQSVRAVFVCLSLSFPVALSAGLEQTLFLLAVKLLCWLGMATATSASGLLKGKGALPFPVELLLLADWVAKPELTQWRRNHAMAHAVPLLQFLVVWLQRAPSARAPTHFLRETAPGPNASIPDPHPFRGWCRQCPPWPATWPQRWCLVAHPDRRVQQGSCRPTWPPLPRSPGWRRTGHCLGVRCAS